MRLVLFSLFLLASCSVSGKKKVLPIEKPVLGSVFHFSCDEWSILLEQKEDSIQDVALSSQVYGDCSFQFPIRHRSFIADYGGQLGKVFSSGYYNPKIERCHLGRKIYMTYIYDKKVMESEESVLASFNQVKGDIPRWGISKSGLVCIVRMEEYSGYVNIGVEVKDIYIGDEKMSDGLIEKVLAQFPEDLTITERQGD